MTKLDSDMLRDMSTECLFRATSKRSQALVCLSADSTAQGERAAEQLRTEAKDLDRYCMILEKAADLMDADYGAMLLKLVLALESRENAIFGPSSTRHVAQSQARLVTREARALLDEWAMEESEEVAA